MEAGALIAGGACVVGVVLARALLIQLLRKGTISDLEVGVLRAATLPAALVCWFLVVTDEQTRRDYLPIVITFSIARFAYGAVLWSFIRIRWHR